MNCPRCGAVNPPGTPACTYCGTPLAVAYPPPQAAAPYAAPSPYGQPVGYPPAAPSPYAAPPPYAPGVGYPQGGYPPAPYGPAGAAGPKTSAMAIIAFIFAFLCSFVGLVLGIIALVRINNSKGQLRGKGVAIAGIILSAIFLVVSIAYQVTR